MNKDRNNWLKYMTSDYRYGTTNVSRCYYRYKNKSKCGEWFYGLRSLWESKKLIIVEGEKTRLGRGNEFLDNAISVKRVICPAENAFEYYEEILRYIVDNIPTECVLLSALGPTATILAYDLAQLGYRALDVGHCDIEYEWYRMGATSKVAIQGKYTNEADGGSMVEVVKDPQYEAEILVRIGT